MRRTLLIVKVVVTAVLLAGVLAAVDVRALRRLLGDASLAYCAAATAALILQTLVLSGRFNAIVAALGRRLPLHEAVEISFIGVLFNQALPSAIGGDAVRAWRLRAGGRPWTESVNAVLLDRAGGVGVLAVLAAVAVTIEPSGALGALRAPLAIVVVAGIVALGLVAVADRLPWLPPAAQRLLATSGLPAATRSVLVPRVLLPTSALSVASHLLAALAAYWLGAALGVELPIGTFFAIALTMVLSMMVPLSFAGWGIREAGALWLFGLAGVDAESAIAISVLYGGVLLVAALPGVPLWLAPSWARGPASRPAPAPVPSPNGRP